MITQTLTKALQEAACAARNAGRVRFETIPDFVVEHPANPVFGDFSANLAMVLATQAKLPPRQVAHALIEYLCMPDGLVERMEVTGAGFINFYLKPGWLHEVLREIHRQGETFGRSAYGQGKRVLVEFVSANPNGPLHLAHGRGAVIGDVLANALDAAGFQVSREYYVNDAAASTQMIRFGESLVVRYLQEFGQAIAFPEDGYHGRHVIEFARAIKERDGDRYLRMPAAERLELFTVMGREAMIDWQRRALAAFGIDFDTWFRESALLESGQVELALAALRERKATYDSEGALWLASIRYGDDADRALVRSNGKPTYLASDIAYHRDKFERGFEMLIDIWGPDHHGYIARTKAAMAALGYNPEELHILIHQGVRPRRDGEFAAAGKPDVLLLSDLLDQVGRDAARFFFLQCSADIDLIFDLDLAVKQVADNPVYFVQHAHARICDILRSAEERGTPIPDPRTTDLSGLRDEAEFNLIRRLSELPDEVIAIADLYEPHRLTRYAQEVARDFHAFYERCPVLKDDTPAPLRDARLVLVDAVRIAMGNVLAILGVSAPERM